MFRLLLDSLRAALADMLRNPLRTFLVLQGMIWGAAAAIMPPAIIDGSRRAMLERSSRVGTDRVVLAADTMDPAAALTEDDARILGERHGDAVKALVPLRARRAVLRAGAAVFDGWVVASWPEEPEARSLALAQGRFFEEGRNECVLEPAVAKALAGAAGPLPPTPVEVFLLPDDAGDGQALAAEVRAGTRAPDLPPLRAVGLLAPLPAERLEVDDFGMKRHHFLSGIATSLMTNMGVDMRKEAWRTEGSALHVPMALLPAADGRVDLIVLKARPEDVVDLIREIQKDLSERRRIALVRWNLLAPVILKGGMDRYTRLRYATFALCLVMGAIVISNVMLFYVLESTREIAIRRVEGAGQMDIALQYLSYASLLSVSGGLLGLPIGLFVAQIRIWLSPSSGLALAFPAGSAALVVACTAAAGILAGVLPAWRAARLDPVRALRHE